VRPSRALRTAASSSAAHTEWEPAARSNGRGFGFGFGFGFRNVRIKLHYTFVLEFVCLKKKQNNKQTKIHKTNPRDRDY
jgi:hypothetical protein